MKVHFLNTVENIVAKGEITHHKQIPLLTQRFQKLSAASKSVCMWERVYV